MNNPTPPEIEERFVRMAVKHELGHDFFPFAVLNDAVQDRVRTLALSMQSLVRETREECAFMLEERARELNMEFFELNLPEADLEDAVNGSRFYGKAATAIRNLNNPQP